MSDFHELGGGVMSDASSEQWVQAAVHGDKAAVGKLCEQHRDRLLRVVRCRLDPRLRSRVDESDIVQETLALAARDLSSYRPQEGVPFFAWLQKLAWRQILRASERHIETRKRTVLCEQRLSDCDSLPSLAEGLACNTTPSGNLAEQELIEKVATAMEAISDLDREVLVLRFLEGLSTAEAAAILEISAAAVRKRLVRALERLRLMLEKESNAIEG
jgi:RNA polymerase sigma-70 factor (ECF subfamily)